MNKVIVIRNDDGSCSIVHPVSEMFDPESRTRIELAEKDLLPLNATENKILKFIINKDVPKGSVWCIINKEDLPEDRCFRSAWELVDNELSVNLEKAQEVKKDHLRFLRTPIMDKLDVEYMKADESGDVNKKVEIVAKKNELRDITSLELPTDLSELRDFLPDCLKNE